MEPKQMEMGQNFGIEAGINENIFMGPGLSGAVDLKNDDLESPFKWAKMKAGHF